MGCDSFSIVNSQTDHCSCQKHKHHQQQKINVLRRYVSYDETESTHTNWTRFYVRTNYVYDAHRSLNYCFCVYVIGIVIVSWIARCVYLFWWFLLLFFIFIVVSRPCPSNLWHFMSLPLNIIDYTTTNARVCKCDPTMVEFGYALCSRGCTADCQPQSVSAAPLFFFLNKLFVNFS